MTDELQQYLLACAIAEKRYEADPWAWMVEQVRTVDEARQVAGAPWPDMDYLHDLVRVLEDENERLICLVKSRRMMASWAVAVWSAWRCRYHRANAVLWQSLTEERSAYALEKRIQYIEDNLRDAPIRRLYKATRTKGGVGNITWDSTGSWVHAVPQGPDVFRSYTPSILIMDECDTQPQAEAALTAALPLAEKQAKIVLITTSQGPSKPAARIAKSAGFTRWT